MKRTTDRFGEYTKIEERVMEIIKEYTELGAEIVRVNEAPDRATYDRVVVLPSGEVKFEFQATEASDFERYHDVRLDVISA